jgi:hypothetical protein
LPLSKGVPRVTFRSQYVAWGAGITLVFVAIGYLAGGREIRVRADSPLGRAVTEQPPASTKEPSIGETIGSAIADALSEEASDDSFEFESSEPEGDDLDFEFVSSTEPEDDGSERRE